MGHRTCTMPIDIACLDPADRFDYGDVFQQLYDDVRVDVDIDTYQPHYGELPESGEHEAVLISGSAFHVYDDSVWLDDTKQYLDNVIGDVPVLGVCYGHQLVADVLGGEVAPLADWHTPDREMGYVTVDKTPAGEDHPLLGDVDETFTSFSSHLDHVARLPENATILATTEYGIQAYAVDDADAYGIQFHPEYNLHMAKELLDGKEMHPDERAAVAETLTMRNALDAAPSRKVLYNFVTEIVDA